MPRPPAAALYLLEEHFRAFTAAKRFADDTGHTVPSDTKSFSEILVSLLTGIPGRARQKGSKRRSPSRSFANASCSLSLHR